MIRPEDLKEPQTYKVYEAGFASGQPVSRDVPAEPGYGQEYGYADVLRSDPHHYPNIVGTKPSDFYDSVRKPPERAVSMPTGVVAKVESWSKPPAEQPLEGGRQSLNCDLSIFGDRFHEPPPPKPKPTGTFDWAKSPQRRRVSEQRSASAQDLSATFGGATWAGRSQQLKKRYTMPPVDPATVNALHRVGRNRVGATYYHPEGSVDQKCGEAGWFGTWTPTAPGLGGLYAMNKAARSLAVNWLSAAIARGTARQRCTDEPVVAQWCS